MRYHLESATGVDKSPGLESIKNPWFLFSKNPLKKKHDWDSPRNCWKGNELNPFKMLKKTTKSVLGKNGKQASNTLHNLEEICNIKKTGSFKVQLEFERVL